MLRLAVVVLFVGIFAAVPARAQDLPAEASARLDAAGADLQAATTTDERVAALREMQAIAEDYPDSPTAELTAALIEQQAVGESGPTAMLDALSTLAAEGGVADTEALATIAGPLLETVADLQDAGAMLPSAAIALDEAIKALDAAAADAGLPSVAEAISQVTGDDALGERITGAIDKIASAADLARQAGDLNEMDEEEKKEYIDNLVGLTGTVGGPAVSGPAFVVFRDQVVWTSEMWGETTNGLNLVTDAMETGQFNHKAYDRIRQRLEDLSKGPWGSDTAKDFLQRLCEQMPVVGDLCKDLFDLAEDLASEVACGAITCDCENVGGGLMSGPLRVTCELTQADLIAECEATGTVTGTCGEDKGPGANY